MEMNLRDKVEVAELGKGVVPTPKSFRAMELRVRRSITEKTRSMSNEQDAPMPSLRVSSQDKFEGSWPKRCRCIWIPRLKRHNVV